MTKANNIKKRSLKDSFSTKVDDINYIKLISCKFYQSNQYVANFFYKNIGNF